MLAMARILRTGAKVLLLDEITEGLAPVIVKKLGEVIQLLKTRGYTIVLVEQNFRFAAPLADRHYVLEHGHVVMTIPKDELSARMDAARAAGRLSPRHTDFPHYPQATGDKHETQAHRPACRPLALRGHRAGPGFGQPGQGRRADRPVGHLFGLAGPGRAGHQDGDRRLRRRREAGFKVELVSADHQNKADIAANKAREWFERDKVDVATELVTTSVALAVQKIAKEKNRIVLMSGPGSTAITNEGCNDVHSVHWTYDTYALANGTAKAVTQGGGKKWFFLTADYAFGHALEKDASDVVKANGGQVVGTVRHPFPGSDFSSFLLKAQSSGAQIIGLANAGGDTINAIKQAAEFGITGKQSLAGLLMFITDVHALGLKNHARTCT
jgi:hypothetical protein